MNSKTSCTLCSSSSLNNSQKLLSSGVDLNLTEKLYLARQKLLPVINNVMKISNENRRNKQLSKSYYLTVEQYEDIVWVSQILREVEGIRINLKNDKCVKKSYNANHFNLERKHIKINKYGKIHVDTSILIQLIELHNTLGDIIKHIQETPIEGNINQDASSYTQTENSNLNEKYDSLERKDTLLNDKLNLFINVNKKESMENCTHKSKNTPNGTPNRKTRNTKKIYNDGSELKPKLVEGILTTSAAPYSKDVLVMSVQNLHPKYTRVYPVGNCPGPKYCPEPKNLSSIPEKKTSNSEVKLTPSNQMTRKTKSTGSFNADDRRSKVTDAVGARDIIVKCISDLSKIRSYFEMECVDVGVTAELQIQRSKSNKNSGTALSRPGSRQSGKRIDSPNCVCEKSDPIEVPVEDLLNKDGTNSRLIICIKGKSEEDDVQIIIRRCSDCENLDAGTDDKMSTYDKKYDVNEESSSCELNKKNESDTDPQCRSVTFSSSDIQPNGLNVIFDPEDPSKSVVKSRVRCPYLSDASSKGQCKSKCLSKSGGESRTICTDKIDSKDSVGQMSDPVYKDSSKNIRKDASTTRDVSRRESCSRIKLYETTNLCFSTEDGQELIISLTIKPKLSKAAKNLSLKDIFSESGTDLSGAKKCGGGGQSKQDRVIPLARTKVCSSLEFDVAVMDTNMRKHGVQHINPNIVVRLKELGVNNLLRACRPVKCGRPAVLNETLCKCLPYSASLISLPLEDADADIINQSYNMSMNKVKQSKIMFKEKIDKVCYSRCSGNTTYKKDFKTIFPKSLNQMDMYKMKSSKRPATDTQLNYYINLVHDVKNTYKERTYEVRFFEIKRYNTNPLRNNEDDKVENQRTSLRINLSANTCKACDTKDVNQKIDSISHKNIYRKKPSENKMPSYNVKHTTNMPRSVKSNISSENSQPRKDKWTKTASKIPVYKFNNTKSVSSRKDDLGCDSDIYDISLQSLPMDDSNLREGHEINTNEDCQDDNKKICAQTSELLEKGNYEISPLSNCSSERTCILTKDNGQTNETNGSPPVGVCECSDSYELYFNNFFQNKGISGQNLHKKTSSKVLKKRKKKSQFRLSSTRSGTFTNDIKQQIMRDANVDIDQARRIEKDCHFEEEKDKCDEDDFMDIINSVKSAFYEYLIRNAFLESKHNVLRNVKSASSLSSCNDVMSDKDLKKIYNKVKNRILEEIMNPTPRFQSQPNVEAGMDHEDISLEIISKLKSKSYKKRSAGKSFKHMNHLESNATQLKHKSFPTYVKSSGSLHGKLPRGVSKSCQISERCFAEMKKILQKNKDFINGQLNSCDHFENFIVTFDSTTSTNLSTSHRNISFEDIFNKYIKYAIQKDSSINKGCDRIMKIMETNSWLEMGMEPIKYLVYQNVIQREDDEFIDSENKRQEEDGKLYCACSSTGRTVISKPKQSKKGTRICRVCGCQILPPKSALSKCSLCLKRIKKEAGETWKSLILPPLLKCTKSVKHLCEKHTSTDKVRYKDKSCQPHTNCYCSKCDKFAEDGSCSCSHCLRINDKSVDAKPYNNEASTQCVCCEATETTADKSISKIPEGKDMSTSNSNISNKSKSKNSTKIKQDKGSNSFDRVKQESTWDSGYLNADLSKSSHSNTSKNKSSHSNTLKDKNSPSNTLKDKTSHSNTLKDKTSPRDKSHDLDATKDRSHTTRNKETSHGTTFHSADSSHDTTSSFHDATGSS